MQRGKGEQKAKFKVIQIKHYLSSILFDVMSNYKISRNVVRKANANMRRNRISSNTEGGVSKGEVIVSVNTGTFSKRIVLSSNQIKAAYKKAVEAYAEKV